VTDAELAPKSRIGFLDPRHPQEPIAEEAECKGEEGSGPAM